MTDHYGPFHVTGRSERERVTNPLDDLNRQLREHQDRRDHLAIKARRLRAELAEVVAEITERDTAIRETRGMLNVAEAVRKQAEERRQQQTTPVNKAPAKRAATKRATKANQPTSEENPS